MKFIFTFIFLSTTTALCAQKSAPKLKNGNWIAELALNENDVLPFNLSIKKGGLFTVENAEEQIALEPAVYKNDSFYVKFPYFNSELVFHVKSKAHVNGYWVNYNKGPHYKIPFTASRRKGSRFAFITKKEEGMSVNGKWEVEFEPNTTSSYPAVGLFEQKSGTNEVSGTFLTETGDYRYLEGNTTADKLFLSCFDGSHAFLFKADLRNDTLYGTFNSGSHWKSEWKAQLNPAYQLTSPDKITYVKDTNQLHFTLQQLNGAPFSYPNSDYTDKVVIIQIMGTWCPNCLDETHYYKELYATYHDRGLEIISIGYEAGSDFESQVKSIERLRDKLDLEFTFLVGGKANKSLASEHFKMLNEVVSFPTSIFIGKDGEVKRVHTGFNGPGTGSHYTEYKNKTNLLIESLLND